MNKIILITGAFGFVGKNLLQYFSTKKQNRIVALDIIGPNIPDYVDYYSWDDVAKIPWNEIDVIIHLAGIAHDTSGAVDEAQYYKINVGLTKKIFDHFLKK